MCLTRGPTTFRGPYRSVFRRILAVTTTPAGTTASSFQSQGHRRRCRRPRVTLVRHATPHDSAHNTLSQMTTPARETTMDIHRRGRKLPGWLVLLGARGSRPQAYACAKILFSGLSFAGHSNAPLSELKPGSPKKGDGAQYFRQLGLRRIHDHDQSRSNRPSSTPAGKIRDQN